MNDKKPESKGLFHYVNPSNWKIDEGELKNQVENYDTLEFGSLRKIAVCFIAFSMLLSLIFVAVGWSPISALIDVLIWLVLAIFVYRGSKLAIVITMLYWTIEKAMQIISGFSGENFNGVNIIAPVVFWGIYMSVFWPTYQIERARKNIKKRENIGSKYKNYRKYIYWAVLIIVFFVGIGLFFRGGTSKPIENATERVTNYFKGAEWKDFNSTIGKFEVLLPVYPEHSVKTVSLPDPYVGEKMTVNMYTAEQSNGATYVVGVSSFSFEIPGNNAKEMLEDSVNGAVAATDGNKLLSSNFVTFLGYQAIDFLFQNKKINAEVKGRFFWAGQTLYELLIIYDPQKYNETDYNKFINSFQLTK